MISLKAIASGLAVCCVASISWAQSPSEIIRDSVFRDIERRIIAEHYGVKFEDIQTSSGMPKWAVKSARGGDAEDDDDDDEDRDNYKNGKDKKDKKNKGYGEDGKHGNGASKGLPPGLAKRSSLPPGLQKQYDKNGRLPPGLAKRDLPDDLRSKLPRRADNQDVVEVGNDVVLIDRATGVILDTILDVLQGGSGGSTPVPMPSPGQSALPDPGPQNSANTGAEPQSAMGRFFRNIFGGQ
jgi:Ni/Co efflux regulator RcnB